MNAMLLQMYRMYLSGVILQPLLLLMVHNTMITGISITCKQKPCYGVMCAIGCETPTRVGNMTPMENCPSYPVGSRIVYKCVHNHEITERSYCKTNGEWTKPERICLKSPERLIPSRTTTTPNTIKPEHEISRSVFTSNGAFSTPTSSTTGREMSTSIAARDKQTLLSSIGTRSMSRVPTTKKNKPAYLTQTTELPQHGRGSNERNIGNETTTTEKILFTKRTGTSSETIALFTTLGVLILITIIVTPFLIKAYINKRLPCLQNQSAQAKKPLRDKQEAEQFISSSRHV